MMLLRKIVLRQGYQVKLLRLREEVKLHRGTKIWVLLGCMTDF